MNNLLILSRDSFKSKLGSDVFIDFDKMEEAIEVITNHPKCPKRDFEWGGEIEFNYQKYYVAGSGSLNSPYVEVVVLRR